MPGKFGGLVGLVCPSGKGLARSARSGRPKFGDLVGLICLSGLEGLAGLASLTGLAGLEGLAAW
jgi:hypothetical protein